MITVINICEWLDSGQGSYSHTHALFSKLCEVFVWKVKGGRVQLCNGKKETRKERSMYESKSIVGV